MSVRKHLLPGATSLSGAIKLDSRRDPAPQKGRYGLLQLAVRCIVLASSADWQKGTDD